jgi:hypothetical protein
MIDTIKTMIDTTDYQQEIVESSGNRIMMAGRRTGKTMTIVAEAVDRFDTGVGERSVVITPTAESTTLVVDEFRRVFDHRDDVRFEGSGSVWSITKDENGPSGSQIVLVSSSTRNGVFDAIRTASTGSNIGAILVDEASYIRQSLLFEIERKSIVDDFDVLLTATPYPGGTIVSTWAEHSPYWKEFRVPSHDSPFIEDTTILDVKENMSGELYELEIEAKYKQDEQE